MAEGTKTQATAEAGRRGLGPSAEEKIAAYDGQAGAGGPEGGAGAGDVEAGKKVPLTSADFAKVGVRYSTICPPKLASIPLYLACQYIFEKTRLRDCYSSI